MGQNYIKNVAIVGAGGNSGKYMAEALLKTGQHIVTAITRAGSTSEFPEGMLVKNVDYNKKLSLMEALRGQDALIITMSIMAPPDQETKLIEAAAAVNVPWVLPNEYSPDTADLTYAREALISKPKENVRALFANLGQSSWIAVVTGHWYEWSLAIPMAYGIDFANRTAVLFDEGETLICTSTWPQVGRAVASLLSLKIHPDGADDKSPCLEQYRDSHVYISSFTVSQVDMLESAMRVTQTNIDEWKVMKEPAKERYGASLQAFQGGDRMGFLKAMYTRNFFPDGSGNYEKSRGLANDVLGLPKEDLDEATEAALQRFKANS